MNFLQKLHFYFLYVTTGIFSLEQKAQTNIGKERIIKSSVGKLHLRRQQLEKLGVEPRTRISPLLEKCCLCLSANESF